MSEEPQSRTTGEQRSVEGFRDPLFESLTDTRRQSVLRYLIEHDGEARFHELVRYVASRENAEPPSQLSPAQRNRVRTSLYQHHLEKLERCGLIRYDKRAGHVTMTCNRAEISRYLGIKTVDLQRIAGFGFGALTLLLGVGIYVLSDPGVVFALVLGSVGVLQLISSSLFDGHHTRILPP